MARGRERGRGFSSAPQVELSSAHSTASSLTHGLGNQHSRCDLEQPWEGTRIVSFYVHV